MTFDLERLANATKGKNAADLYLTYEGEVFTYAELGWCDWIVTWIRDCFTDYKIANICHVFQKALLQYYSQKSSLPPAQIIAKRAGLEVFVQIFAANKASFEKYASSDLQAAFNQYGTIEKNTPAAVAPREEKKADVKDNKDALERFGALAREKADLEKANANLMQDNVRLGDAVETAKTRAQRAEAQVTELNEAAAKRIAEHDHPPAREDNPALAKRLKQYEQQIERQREDIHKFEEENRALAQALHISTQKLNKAEGDATERLNKVQERFNEVVRELDQLKLEISKRNEQAKINAHRLGGPTIEAAAATPASDEQIQQLSTENAALKTKIANLEANIRKANASVEEVERQYRVLKKFMSETFPPKDAEIASLKNANFALKNEMNALTAKMKFFDENPIGQMKLEIAKLKVELKNAKDEIAYLETRPNGSSHDGKEEAVQNDTEFDVSGKGEFDET